MGAPEHVEQLQTCVRALSAMGLTYAEISEIEGVSRDTVNTWGKGTSRAHGAFPVTKIGRTSRVIAHYMRTLDHIRRYRIPPLGAARVTVRRVCDTPGWALRLALASAQGWLIREAICPPGDGESYSGLPCTPTIETRPAGTVPGGSLAYKRGRGSWPVGASFKIGISGFPPTARHVVIDVPNLIFWAMYGLPTLAIGDYPWRPDTTGE